MRFNWPQFNHNLLDLVQARNSQWGIFISRTTCPPPLSYPKEYDGLSEEKRKDTIKPQLTHWVPVRNLQFWIYRLPKENEKRNGEAAGRSTYTNVSISLNVCPINKFVFCRILREYFLTRFSTLLLICVTFAWSTVTAIMFMIIQFTFKENRS